ncbi:MAG: hypothetical protein E6899_04250 [Neisseria sp.]|nr:hypothetical protein [Neisseria sp.]
MTGKFGGVVGRALRYLPWIVAWALPTESSVWFSSREITWRFFRGQSPRYGWLGQGRLKSWGDGFQTTF